MNSARTRLSAQQATELRQVARREESGVSGGFAHRRALQVTRGSTTPASLVHRARGEKRTLTGGVEHRITAGGHQPLRQLRPAGTRRGAR
jgi:hypothetical protein